MFSLRVSDSADCFSGINADVACRIRIAHERRGGTHSGTIEMQQAVIARCAMRVSDTGRMLPLAEWVLLEVLVL